MTVLKQSELDFTLLPFNKKFEIVKRLGLLESMINM